jgi:hypothetical protein
MTSLFQRAYFQKDVPVSLRRPKGSELRAEQRLPEYPEEDYPHTDEDAEIELDSGPEEEHVTPAVRVFPVAAPPAQRPIITWEAGTIDVDVTTTRRVTQIASKNRGRKRLFIRNVSLANVFLVSNRETLHFLGFRLMAAQEVELTHNDDVWAYAEAGGTAATITFLAEYEVEEEDIDNG